jgi:hypothetical protein
VKTGRVFRQVLVCCLLRIVFKLCIECPTREGLEGFGYFSKGGQVNLSVNCVDDLALLVREEAVLTESERCYGMEICVKKLR